MVRCAKDLDLVHRLDELVLRRLGDVRQAWLDLGPLRERIPYISVNISAGSVANIQRQDALDRKSTRLNSSHSSVSRMPSSA